MMSEPNVARPERGRRRIHQTPKRFEVEACRPWLDEEIDQVKPDALVVLGAVAGKALFGASFRITRERGRLLESGLAPIVSATIHPSAILRSRDDELKSAERKAFAEDLRSVAQALAKAADERRPCAAGRASCLA